MGIRSDSDSILPEFDIVVNHSMYTVQMVLRFRSEYTQIDTVFVLFTSNEPSLLLLNPIR